MNEAKIWLRESLIPWKLWISQINVVSCKNCDAWKLESFMVMRKFSHDISRVSSFLRIGACFWEDFSKKLSSSEMRLGRNYHYWCSRNQICWFRRNLDRVSESWENQLGRLNLKSWPIKTLNFEFLNIFSFEWWERWKS